MISYRVRARRRLRKNTRSALIVRVGRLLGRGEGTKAWTTRAFGWGLAGAGVGWLWLGIAGAAGGCVVAVAVPLIGLWRRRRERSSRVDEALPDLMEEMAAALRAGANLPLAIHETAAPPPLETALNAARNRLRVGGSIEEALAAFRDSAGTERAALFAMALTLGHRSGGDVPRVLGVLAEAGRDRARLAREIRAATAQSRLSAWVVALMPVAFLLLMGATSRDQVRLLLRTPAGWALLAAGGLLEGLGILWMRKLEPR